MYIMLSEYRNYRDADGFSVAAEVRNIVPFLRARKCTSDPQIANRNLLLAAAEYVHGWEPKWILRRRSAKCRRACSVSVLSCCVKLSFRISLMNLEFAQGHRGQLFYVRLSGWQSATFCSFCDMQLQRDAWTHSVPDYELSRAILLVTGTFCETVTLLIIQAYCRADG